MTTSGLQARRVPIPATQDPFVNTPLISVGPDASGTERFWTSTWNSTSGTLGILVSSDGSYRVYRFPKPHHGFYSAVVEDPQTLWLCGDLSRVVRLDLTSGEFESFETGAPEALVFQGMAYDRPTGKLFAAAFPVPDRVAFSFDTRNRTSARVYRGIAGEHYMSGNFAHPDGTHTVLFYNPGIALLQWDPVAEGLVVGQLGDLLPGLPRPYERKIGRVVVGPSGAVRLAGCWYDPATRAVVAGPEPERELAWFACRGDRVWGVSGDGGSALVAVWDLADGSVTDLVTIPDATADSVCLTVDGDVIAVSLYGVLHRFDGWTGERKFRIASETDAVGHVDCLRRIDDRRVLGTPFITQRFWEVDLDSGEGVDRGRATGGSGEVLRTWLLNGLVYQASYTQGQLSAYDPSQPADFPHNPRIVTQPPTGMRPIASADDGQRLFYACSHHYGHLGGVLTRYDTTTGAALHVDDPLPDLAINSLVRDPQRDLLVAGSTIHADCQSAEPAASAAALAVIDPETLTAVRTAVLPAGVEQVVASGLLDADRVVCVATPPGGADPQWFAVAIDDLVVPPTTQWQDLPGGASRMVATGHPGIVVLVAAGRQELWDLRGPERLRVLAEEPDAYLVHVDGDDLLLATPSEIVVLDGVLA